MPGNFANAKVEKLIRDAGAQRVSSDAIAAMNELLTDYGTRVAKYAVEIAKNGDRKTIKEQDIVLATQK